MQQEIDMNRARANKLDPVMRGSRSLRLFFLRRIARKIMHKKRRFLQLPNWGKLLCLTILLCAVITALLAFLAFSGGDSIDDLPKESELYVPFFR